MADLTRVIAEVRLRQYDSEYSASHLTWEDFTGEAQEIVAALAPLIEDYFERTVVAVAWDEGYTAGHMTARAVNPEYPAPATNPYLAEEEDND